MHLSSHNWMSQEPIETTLARLSRLGFKSIEISGEPEKYDPKHVNELLDRYNMKCWGSVTLMLGERNMQSANEATSAMSV